MSAPQTNIKKQRRRHKGPLVGLTLVVIFGVGLILYWIFELFAEAPEHPGEREIPSLAPPAGEGPTVPVETLDDAEATVPVGDTPAPGIEPGGEPERAVPPGQLTEPGVNDPALR